MNLRALLCLLVFPLLLTSSAPGQERGKAATAELRQKAVTAWEARDWENAAAAWRAVVETDGQDAEGWHHLGYALHALGKLDAALEAHLKAAAFPSTRAKGTYNVACVHALQGRADDAFAWLRKAADAGVPADFMRSDEDLARIRSDPRFARLMAELETPKKNVAILVHEGVELLDFAGPGEVFAAAGVPDKGPAFRVYTVADAATPITSQRFLTVTPQYTFENCPKPDVIVLPGGNTRIPLASPKVMRWVKEASADAEVVLSVCTGAFLLARSGLLDDLEATTHHSAIERLRKEAQKTKVHADRRFVDNGKIVTAAGVSAGIDASLHVVARMLGEEAARRTARYMEYAWTPGPDPKGTPAK